MGRWDELVGEAKKRIEEFRRRSREAADHARLRLEKASLQREQTELFKQLGREVFALSRQGVSLPESLMPLLAELERLSGDIAVKQEAIRASPANEALPQGGAATPEADETHADR